MFKNLQSCAEITQYSVHFSFQVHDERSRVMHLLDSIVITDTQFLAAINNLGLEDNIMMDDFKKAVNYSLIHHPFSNGKVYGNNNGDVLDHVSEAEASESLFAS